MAGSLTAGQWLSFFHAMLVLEMRLTVRNLLLVQDRERHDSRFAISTQVVGSASVYAVMSEILTLNTQCHKDVNAVTIYCGGFLTML